MVAASLQKGREIPRLSTVHYTLCFRRSSREKEVRCEDRAPDFRDDLRDDAVAEGFELGTSQPSSQPSGAPMS
jgi:hypothetical protein